MTPQYNHFLANMLHSGVGVALCSTHETKVQPRVKPSIVLITAAKYLYTAQKHHTIPMTNFQLITKISNRHSTLLGFLCYPLLSLHIQMAPHSSGFLPASGVQTPFPAPPHFNLWRSITQLLISPSPLPFGK